MSVMALRVRHDPLAYRSWRAWRARRARLPVTVEVAPCWRCWQQGMTWDEVYPREAHDMSREDRSRPPHYLPVLCGACGGRRVVETVVDVEG